MNLNLWKRMPAGSNLYNAAMPLHVAGSVWLHLNNEVVFGQLSPDGKQVRVALDIHACDLDNVYHLRDTLEEFVRAAADGDIPVPTIVFENAAPVLYSPSAALQYVGAVLDVRSGDAEIEPAP